MSSYSTLKIKKKKNTPHLSSFEGYSRNQPIILKLVNKGKETVFILQCLFQLYVRIAKLLVRGSFYRNMPANKLRRHEAKK